MSAADLAQVAASGLLIGLLYALIAAGLSLIFGLMDVVNFAHGELLMLAMYATFLLNRTAGLDPLLATPLIALFLFALGLLLYRGLMARALTVTVNRGMVQIFITFGLAIFLRGAAQFAFGAEFRSIPKSWLANESARLGPVILPWPQLAAGLIAFLAFLLLFLVLRSEFGRALEATREDREAVALIGIDRERIFALGFGLGTGAVGIAGAALAAFYYISPDVGANFALIAYVTVALGGFGSLAGALLAGILIGEVEAFTAFLLTPSLKQLGMFALYVAVLALRPQGLFGARQ
jgi:branched-chain amino acid transport system permease protein